MSFRTNKALFLDRDGVINVNFGYVHQPEKFEFIPGIFELCRAAQRKGYRIIIVTNQSGIARAYYNREEFIRLTEWVHQRFFRQGINISRTYFCPHHPKQTSPYGRPCACRKPSPGMIFRARDHYRINLSQSLMVGDSLSDMQCASKARIGKAVLLKHQAPNINGLKLEAPAKTPYYRAYELKAVTQLL